MKTHKLIFGAFCIAGSAVAAPEWNGVVMQGGSAVFALSDSETGVAAWVKVGGEFEGYKIEVYDAKVESIKISRDGEAKLLKMSPGKVRPPHDDEVNIDQLSDVELADLGLYRIKAGDSGSKIARKFQLTLAELQSLNTSVQWTKLKVGQILVT
jgi:hypothetical protein